MAKINLRAYNRQIEDLIARGEYQEAIAHCRHILEKFPKHVDTYRLLGKAYLEAGRHNEAADVFQRVLAAAPDDFIAHAGLSVVHENRDDLKAALWHMERAFEVQPSSPAIQDELRRLYEKMEGVAPARLRLTRGALARMYLRNGLYLQAIAELRAALAEEPHRADLMALLAEALYQNGNNLESASTASSLLQKLPYCLHANRLMARILTENQREEEAKVYRRRLYALEPYEAYRSSPDKPLAEVPDEVVTLEALAWTPEMAMPTWTSPESAPPPPTAAEPPPPAPATEESTSSAATAEETPNLETAELPDWVKAMAPEDILASSPSKSDSLHEEAAEESEIDTDLAALLARASESTTDAEAVETVESAAEEEPLPEWLAGVAEESAAHAEAAEGIEAVETVESAAEEEPLPEWLAGVEEETPTTPATTTTAPTPPDDALAWLESLAAKHGADEAELITSPEERSETPPQWVAESAETVETAAEEEPLPEWLAGVAEENAADAEAAEGTEAVETVETAAAGGGLPEWLAGVEEKGAAHAEAAETSPTTTTIKPTETNEESQPEWLAALEAEIESEKSEETPLPPEWHVAANAAETNSAFSAEQTAAASPHKGKKSRLAAEQQLTAARDALEEGDITTAIKFYGKLISKKRYVSEVIVDLEQALIRYPVHVELWQTLGDAYARQDRLSEAMEAYNKAEALLR